MAQKIVINLWFDNEAEEAAKFYASVFKDSKINNTTYYQTETPSDKEIGSVLTVDFEINGQPFIGLNGGPMFKFNEAISLMVNCEDQGEVDYYWEKMSANPESEQCGWLKDKFGVSWQVIPKQLSELMSNPDPKVSKRVMDALLKMKKIDVAGLQAAAKH